jgi:hypothetical protein
VTIPALDDILTVIAGVAAVAALVSLYVWIGYWIYDDARRRGMHAAGWVIAWFLFNFTALIIYFLVRPRGAARP